MMTFFTKKHSKQLRLPSDLGFTLVELLTTSVILALLATLALPSFFDYLKRLEAQRISKSLRAVLLDARNEALIRSQPVITCLTDNGQQCSKTAAQHIMSFVDNNHNAQFDSLNDTLLNKQPLNMRYGHLKFRFGGRNQIKFFPDTGKPRGHMGNITYCPDSGDMAFAKSIILSEHGRARLSFDFNGDGVDDKRSSSDAISCQ